MQWFNGIDDALTKPERTLLAQLKLKARAGKDVSPYPGHDQYSKLCARYERKADLRRFQQQAETFAFSEVIVGEQLEWISETLVGYTAGQPRRWLERFNLPTKKQAYDQLKANLLEAGLVDYSQEAQLFLQQQAAEEIAVIQQYNASDVLDRAKAAKQVAIARRLFSELRQYVEEDLKRLTTPPDKEKKAELSLRQAAILYYYNNQPLTENNVAKLAADAGHESKTSGKQLLEKYAAWCELQESELQNKSRELGATQRDLECVRPRLEGEAAARADAYLSRIIEKKKRGF